ncbi:MAG: hypothetical protein DWP97_12410 [Calditrichaeota bacterium]|nr:MAG: hypothetical protein DWP97_12410 [Calditrichota bacterium]
MKPVIIAGTTIVNLALIFYTIFIIQKIRHNKATGKVLFFLTAGVLFDIIATACMIIGSENSPFSPHGILGYSSLGAMLTDCILIWRFKNNNSPETQFPKSLSVYSTIAYSWWVLAYITGAIMVFAFR